MSTPHPRARVMEGTGTYVPSVSSTERRREARSHKRKPVRTGRQRGTHADFEARHRPHATQAKKMPVLAYEPPPEGRSVSEKLLKYLRPLQKLKDEFPHLAADPKSAHLVTTAESAAALAGDPDGDAVLDTTDLWTREQPHMPVHETLFKHVRQLPEPRIVKEYSAGVTHEEWVADLRQGRRKLPIVQFSEESVLLGQAGDWTFCGVSVRWPACYNGDRCMGVTELKTQRHPNGVLLTQWMTHEEVKVLAQTGQGPSLSQKRCCVLCLRHHMESFVDTMVRNKNQLQRMDPTRIIQPYAVLVNESGGYNERDCLIPDENVWCGLVGPFPRMETSKLSLRVSTEQGGRLMVDQSALAYIHPENPNARVGTGQQALTLQSFRERSLASGGLEGARQRLRLERVGLACDPRRAMLRDYDEAYLVRLGLNMQWLTLPIALIQTTPLMRTVCLENLEKVYNHPQSPSKLVHLLALASDLIQGLGDGLNVAVHVDVREELMNSSIHAGSKANMNKELTALLSKALPQPCQIRKMGAMLMKTLRSKPCYRPLLFHLVVATLSGSYPHVERVHRPTWQVRWALLEKLRSDEAWFMKLAEQLPWTVHLAVQEHMLWLSDTMPVFRETMTDLYCWHGFRTVLLQGLAPLRDKISQVVLAPEWSEAALLEIDTMQQTIKNQLIPPGHPRGRRKFYDRFPSNQQKRPDGTWANESDPMEGLTLEKLDLLDQWAQRLPRDVDPMDEVHRLVHMGVSSSCLATLQGIRERWDRPKNRMGDKELGTRLSEVYEAHPYSYRVVRYFCAQVSWFRGIRIQNLPYEYVERQLEAVSNRAHPATGRLPRDVLQYVLCMVCMSSYSLENAARPAAKRRMEAYYQKAPDLKKVMTTRTGHSQHAMAVLDGTDRTERMGYDRIRVEPGDGGWYCSREETRNGQRWCQDQCLTKLHLIGRSIVFRDRKVVMRCPQLGCGAVMTYSRASCGWNSRGVMCTRCADARRLQEEEAFMVLPISTNKRPAGCLVCNIKLTDEAKGDSAYVLPHGVLLCQRHAQYNRGGLLANVPLWPCLSAEDVAESVRHYVARVEAAKAVLGKRKRRADLSRSKRKLRDPKRR